MPTAPTSPSTSKAPAAKSAGTKAASSSRRSTASSARTSSASRATTPRTSRATQSKATTAKAARTRAVHKSEEAFRATETATRSTAELVGDYAERAILIPVGAALIARERVVSGVGEVISSYSTPAKTQAQLRKFERRGSTARNRLEREVRKTRTRVERELRERRKELDKQRGQLTKGLTKGLSSQVEQTQSQIEKAVRARLDDGAELANRVQDRVLSLV